MTNTSRQGPREAQPPNVVRYLRLHCQRSQCSENDNTGCVFSRHTSVWKASTWAKSDITSPKPTPHCGHCSACPASPPPPPTTDDGVLSARWALRLRSAVPCEGAWVHRIARKQEQYSVEPVAKYSILLYGEDGGSSAEIVRRKSRFHVHNI